MIHRNFFSQEWQIAWEIDPVCRTEGVFRWSGGALALSPFAVADRDQIVDVFGMAASGSPAPAAVDMLDVDIEKEDAGPPEAAGPPASGCPAACRGDRPGWGRGKAAEGPALLHNR